MGRDKPDDGRAHDDSVGNGCHFCGLVRSGDAEADGTGNIRVFPDQGDHAAKVRGDGAAYSGNAEARNDVQKSGRLPGDQPGQEAYIHDYYDFPWDGVLRYTGDSSGEDKMHMIIQPFGENYLCYFNGEKIFYLSHPDQVEVLQMLFEQCNGKRMPSIILGAKDAPWFTRLREVFG